MVASRMFKRTMESVGRLRVSGGVAGERPAGRSRASLAPLLYLIAFSAVVTFFYDEALFRRSNFKFKAGVEWDESLQGFRPSKEQLAHARKLNLEDRLLATTKDVWPECRAQGMTAIQCKDFIDDEILNLFTDEDKFIRTRIIGGRTLEDDWYNAVSIVMDDSNMVLGQDGDGWIRYTFEWDGSGTAATEEQQQAIPPVTAEETAAGAAQGNQVTTILTPNPNDAFDPIVPAPPPATTEAPPGPAPGTTVAPGTTATEGTTTTATTTTELTTTITVTVPPFTVPPFEPIVTQAPPITGGVVTTTTIPPGEPFNFDQPPVVPEADGPVLVEGATTDGAIAGTDSNPINGGVVLNDGTSTPGGQGEIILEQTLNTPPVIEPAGSRTVGPFDCRGMNGFQCCLGIKHLVRDADINGRAIQCHLTYEETTCSAEWWTETETSKKVLIYTNENEMVLQDPVISGSWPQCDEVWTDVRDWADAAGASSGGAAATTTAAPEVTEAGSTTTTSAPDAGWGGNVVSTEECVPVGDGARCGADHGGLPCCDGYCCSAWGYCGTGAAWCDFGCQSQCWANSDTTGLTVTERCGDAQNGRLCHGTYCCSADGYCGSGEIYCETSQGCQSGCWPDEGDGTAPATEIPPTIEEECRGSVNICFAMDMSGSVCSPDFFNPQQCKNCPSECKESGHTRHVCCANFATIQQFGIDVINWVNHLQFGANRRSFSLATFSDWGSTAVAFGGDVLQGIADLDYKGGLTNHGDALIRCQQSFDGQEGQNYILLVTDGVATTSGGSSFNKAAGEAHGRATADDVKSTGTIIETVFINPGQANAAEQAYMNYMSTSGQFHDIGDFESLGTEVNDVAYKLACSGASEHIIVPEDVADVVTHCGCATCTDTVWETWVGEGWSWYTCGSRIEWMMSHPRNYIEKHACDWVTAEYPTGCPCDCGPG